MDSPSTANSAQIVVLPAVFALALGWLDSQHVANSVADMVTAADFDMAKWDR